MVINNCKRCDSEQLYEDTREVLDLDENFYIKVSGIACKSCNCFHYEIDNYEVFQFNNREQVENNAAGKYVTDYDLKTKKYAT